MRMRGLEPPPGCPDTDLNRRRLPIPPHPRADEQAKIAHRKGMGGPARGSGFRASHRLLDGVGLVLGALLASSRIDRAPLSSRGLGRRPLMAETRVRIPVAGLTTKALTLPGLCYVTDDAHGRSALRVTHSERTSGLRAPAISSSGSMRSRPEYSSIRCAYVESSTASECPACLATSTGWRPSARRGEGKLWRRS